jgi:hypothetical protein
MSRGLSDLQRRVLAVLADQDRPVPVSDLTDRVEVGRDSDPRRDRLEHEFRTNPDTDWQSYFRDRAFSVRRAISALVRRGLLKETMVEVEWQRQGRFVMHTRLDWLLAVTITEAGREAAKIKAAPRL